MKMFAGFYKKSIAGMACTLGIFFISVSVYSSTAETASTQGVEPSSSLASSTGKAGMAVGIVESSILEKNNLENKGVSAPTPVSSNSSLATPKQTLPPQTSSTTTQLASLIGGLVLILVLIYGLSWFVKRFSQGGFLQNPTIKIVSAMPLGTRERLMLVDVGGKQLLLGVTATQINTLHVFDEPVTIAEKSQPIVSDFSQKLMAILQQKNSASADNSAQKKSNY